MLFSCKSQRAAPAVLGAILSIMLAVPVMANEADYPVLLVQLDDTTATVGSDDAWVSVYLQNFQDTLAGFSLRVVAGSPDIIEFRTDVEDTTIVTRWWECLQWIDGECVDSIPLDPPQIDTVVISGGIDTVGSAISGWQYVSATSYSPNLLDIRVVGLASTLDPPYNPGLPPQEFPILLFRLRVRVAEELPFASDSTVRLLIDDNLNLTSFSDPHGNLIGTATNYNICDTTYWKCLEWIGDECTAWAPGSPEDYDLMRIDTFYTYWCCDEWSGDECLSWSVCLPPGDSVSLDSLVWTSVDYDVTFYGDGLFMVDDGFCCDIPGDVNGDGILNVGDPVFIINYIFKPGPAPSCPWAADCNGDCQIDVADVICMLRPIFQIWPYEPVQCAPDTCQYDGY